jgi:type II secretory pathway pseudopilin PulG
MKFGASNNRRYAHGQSGFTLAEVLAALLFMAIVIPVAMQGLRIASLAGEVAQRKLVAARVAERVLAENLVTTNWNKSVQSGTVVEGEQQFAWTLRNENWSQDAMQQLSVEVSYTAQDKQYSVRLSTLVDNNVLIAQPTTQQQ